MELKILGVCAVSALLCGENVLARVVEEHLDFKKARQVFDQDETDSETTDVTAKKSFKDSGVIEKGRVSKFRKAYENRTDSETADVVTKKPFKDSDVIGKERVNKVKKSYEDRIKFYDVFQQFKYKKSDCKFTASSEYDKDHVAANAFDGSSDTKWASKERGNQWLQIKLPKATVCNSAQIASRGDNDGYFVNQAPRDFEIQGSTDGECWVSLCKKEGISWDNLSGETKSFLFKNSTAYTYYRLVITADNEPDDKDIKNYSLSQFKVGRTI